MNSFFLLGLFIAAVSAGPISDRVDKIESNLTHIWGMIHDMEEHHGEGVHIHVETDNKDGTHGHESTHLSTDGNNAHVYLHMDMHNDFDDVFEVTGYSEEEDGEHHHHHEEHMGHDDEHVEHHGDDDDHSDADNGDDGKDMKNVHHHHHHHHHHHRNHHKVMKEAHCDLVANGDVKGVSGHIHLKEIEHNLMSVHVDLHCPSDSKPGSKLALHVHEGNDMSNGCDSLGGHFNPDNTEHGSRTDSHDKRHVGDWSNVICDINKEIGHEFYERVSHLSGPHSIMNRSLVLHHGTDDHGKGDSPSSKTSGAAGKRLACCIIKEKMH